MLNRFVSSIGSVSRTSFANKHVSLFLGNRAADADSVISSLVLAYMNWHDDKEHDRVFLPLCFISRDDLPLRSELASLLQRCSININDLLLWETFSSSLNDLQLDCAKSIQLTLLDHNAVDDDFFGKLSAINPTAEVVEIMDHHRDENRHSSVEAHRRRIAFDEVTMKASVGSCCTIVAEYLQQKSSPILDEVAELLLGVILLDTLNMDAEAQKGTERDFRMIQFLSKSLLMTTAQCNALYDLLSNAKNDPTMWRSLTTLESLRFDFKVFTMSSTSVRVGFSSVLLSLSDFVKKADLEIAVKSFIEQHNLAGLVVMTFFRRDENDCFAREILVFEKNVEGRCAVADGLRDNSLLELEPLSFPQLTHDFSDSLRANGFNQRNVKMSRKQVAPIVSAM